MSVEGLPKSPQKENLDTEHQTDVADLEQARKMMLEGVKPPQVEKKQPSQDFEVEKGNFLEKARESLAALRERSVSVSGELQSFQDAIDARGAALSGLGTSMKNLEAARSRTLGSFDKLAEALELVEQQIDNPQDLAEAKRSFESSLNMISSGLDQEERVCLGRIPQRELDAMPKFVRSEIMLQQQVAESFPDDMSVQLDAFRQRLNTIRAVLDPRVASVIDRAISNTDNLLSSLKLIPGIRRLGLKPNAEEAMSKIDGALRNGEEQAKARR